jgi:hypothetical protein
MARHTGPTGVGVTGIFTASYGLFEIPTCALGDRNGSSDSYDDNRSLGSGETGGRVALPVFKEVVLRAYGEKLLGPVPLFPAEMEQHIDGFLEGNVVDAAAVAEVIAAPAKPYGDLRLPLEAGLNTGADSRTSRITPSPVSIRAHFRH